MRRRSGSIGHHRVSIEKRLSIVQSRRGSLLDDNTFVQDNVRESRWWQRLDNCPNGLERDVPMSYIDANQRTSITIEESRRILMTSNNVSERYHISSIGSLSSMSPSIDFTNRKRNLFAKGNNSNVQIVEMPSDDDETLKSYGSQHADAKENDNFSLPSMRESDPGVNGKQLFKRSFFKEKSATTAQRNETVYFPSPIHSRASISYSDSIEQDHIAKQFFKSNKSVEKGKYVKALEATEHYTMVEKNHDVDLSEDTLQPRRPLFKSNAAFNNERKKSLYAAAVSYEKSGHSNFFPPPSSNHSSSGNSEKSTSKRRISHESYAADGDIEMQDANTFNISDNINYDQFKQLASSTVIGSELLTTPGNVKNIKRLSKLPNYSAIVEENTGINSNDVEKIKTFEEIASSDSNATRLRNKEITLNNKSMENVSKKNNSNVKLEKTQVRSSPRLSNKNTMNKSKSVLNESIGNASKKMNTDGTPEAVRKHKVRKTDDHTYPNFDLIDNNETLKLNFKYDQSLKKVSRNVTLKSQENSRVNDNVLNQSEIDRLFIDEMKAKRTNPPVRRSTMFMRPKQGDSSQMENDAEDNTADEEISHLNNRYPIRHSNIPVALHSGVPFNVDDIENINKSIDEVDQHNNFKLNKLNSVNQSIGQSKSKLTDNVDVSTEDGNHNPMEFHAEIDGENNVSEKNDTIDRDDENSTLKNDIDVVIASHRGKNNSAIKNIVDSRHVQDISAFKNQSTTETNKSKQVINAENVIEVNENIDSDNKTKESHDTESEDNAHTIFEIINNVVNHSGLEINANEPTAHVNDVEMTKNDIQNNQETSFIEKIEDVHLKNKETHNADDSESVNNVINHLGLALNKNEHIAQVRNVEMSENDTQNNQHASFSEIIENNLSKSNDSVSVNNVINHLGLAMNKNEHIAHVSNVEISKNDIKHASFAEKIENIRSISDDSESVNNVMNDLGLAMNKNEHIAQVSNVEMSKTDTQNNQHASFAEKIEKNRSISDDSESVNNMINHLGLALNKNEHITHVTNVEILKNDNQNNQQKSFAEIIENNLSISDDSLALNKNKHIEQANHVEMSINDIKKNQQPSFSEIIENNKSMSDDSESVKNVINHLGLVLNKNEQVSNVEMSINGTQKNQRASFAEKIENNLSISDDSESINNFINDLGLALNKNAHIAQANNVEISKNGIKNNQQASFTEKIKNNQSINVDDQFVSDDSDSINKVINHLGLAMSKNKHIAKVSNVVISKNQTENVQQISFAEKIVDIHLKNNATLTPHDKSNDLVLAMDKSEHITQADNVKISKNDAENIQQASSDEKIADNCDKSHNVIKETENIINHSILAMNTSKISRNDIQNIQRASFAERIEANNSINYSKLISHEENNVKNQSKSDDNAEVVKIETLKNNKLINNTENDATSMFTTINNKDRSRHNTNCDELMITEGESNFILEYHSDENSSVGNNSADKDMEVDEDLNMTSKTVIDMETTLMANSCEIISTKNTSFRPSAILPIEKVPAIEKSMDEEPNTSTSFNSFSIDSLDRSVLNPNNKRAESTKIKSSLNIDVTAAESSQRPQNISVIGKNSEELLERFKGVNWFLCTPIKRNITNNHSTIVENESNFHRNVRQNAVNPIELEKYRQLQREAEEKRDKMAEEFMKELFDKPKKIAKKLYANHLAAKNKPKNITTEKDKNKSTKKTETIKIPTDITPIKEYKAPKLYMKEDWITPRLYTFLQSKLEPKYNIKCRNRSEKFVKDLASIVNIVLKTKNDFYPYVVTLRNEMARLKIVETHWDFHRFIIDYLPFHFRIKAIPAEGRDIPELKESVYEPILKN